MGAETATLGGALGLSAGEGIIGGILGKSSADTQYEYQRRLQKHDQEFQREMRDTQYQSTVQDMQKAGINPAVALSGGAGLSQAQGGSSASAPNVNLGQGLENLAETLQATGATALLQSQKDKIDSETNLNNETAGKTKNETKAVEIDNEIKQIMAPLEAQLKTTENKKAKAEINKIIKEIAKYEKEMAEIDAHIENLKADGKLKEAQTETEKRVQKGIQTREWIKTIAGAIGNLASMGSAF